MAIHRANSLQFGMNMPLSIVFLVGMLLAGWVNARFEGVLLAGLAIFALAMLQKMGYLGSWLWLPRGSVAEWITYLVIIVVLIALLMPAVQTNCRVRRADCSDRRRPTVRPLCRTPNSATRRLA